MHFPRIFDASIAFASIFGLALGDSRHVAPRVVGLKIRQESIPNPHRRDQEVRRRRAVEATLDNLVMLYSLDISVGTPGQLIPVFLDTGSSDLWVNTPNSDLCRGPDNPCAQSYSANLSSSYNYVGSHFDISYVDGSAASGDYVQDSIALGNITLQGCQFGIGYNSTTTASVLGIGYPSNEVQVSRAGMEPYDNLPAKMVTQGLIQSNAYSLYLGNLQASTGSILFGGVDTGAFVGDLMALPILPGSSGKYNTLRISLSRITAGSTVVGDNLSLATLLDSGTTLTYLPDDMANEIFNIFGADHQDEDELAHVSCELAAQMEGNVTFTFSEAQIVVPLSELVIDLLQKDGSRPKLADGTDACLFGIAPAGNGSITLGATFMRSAYIVFDMDNNEISLAQANPNANSSNILEIGRGKDAVPSAVRVSTPAPEPPAQSREVQNAGIRVSWNPIFTLSSSIAAILLVGVGLFA